MLHELDPASAEVIGGIEIDLGGIGYLEQAPDGRLFGASAAFIHEIDVRTGEVTNGPGLGDNAFIARDFVFAPDGTGYGYALGTLGASYLFSFETDQGKIDSLYTAPDDIDHDIGPLAWVETYGVVLIRRSTHDVVRFVGDGEIETVGHVAGLEGIPIGTARGRSGWLVSTYVEGTGANLLFLADIEAGWAELIGELDGPDVINGLAIVACSTDVNGDGELNVLDFVAFQLAWQGQDAIADCDGDGDWTVLDFVCFQAMFIEGCE